MLQADRAVGSAKIPLQYNYKAIFAGKNGCLYECMHGPALLLKAEFKSYSSVLKLLHRHSEILLCCTAFGKAEIIKMIKKGIGLIFNDTASLIT